MLPACNKTLSSSEVTELINNNKITSGGCTQRSRSNAFVDAFTSAWLPKTMFALKSGFDGVQWEQTNVNSYPSDGSSLEQNTIKICHPRCVQRRMVYRRRNFRFYFISIQIQRPPKFLESGDFKIMGGSDLTFTKLRKSSEQGFTVEKSHGKGSFRIVDPPTRTVTNSQP